MTCNEPKWLQVVPVPGSGGGGWGGVWHSASTLRALTQNTHSGGSERHAGPSRVGKILTPGAVPPSGQFLCPQLSHVRLTVIPGDSQ